VAEVVPPTLLQAHHYLTGFSKFFTGLTVSAWASFFRAWISRVYILGLSFVTAILAKSGLY